MYVGKWCNGKVMITFAPMNSTMLELVVWSVVLNALCGLLNRKRIQHVPFLKVTHPPEPVAVFVVWTFHSFLTGLKQTQVLRLVLSVPALTGKKKKKYGGKRLGRQLKRCGNKIC
jgi:hypothetical protein